MLLGTFYNAVEVHRREKILFVKLLAPHRVMSTCRISGGIREDATCVINHQVCEPAGHAHGHSTHITSDPAAYRRELCDRHGLRPEESVVLGTAANMNNAAIARESFRELEVVSVCTGGVEANAGRVGDPASVYEREDGFETLAGSRTAPANGTINIMLFINRELAPGALVRSVVTATEAKTAVLQELNVNSRYSDGLATGTGTDQIAVACRLGTGKPLTGAGKHCSLGELIGKSVYRGVKDTLALQNQLTPPGQCSARRHLERFGATREGMLEGIGDRLDEHGRQLLANNMTSIDRDPVTVAAVASLVHLRDKVAWGVLPGECRPEIMGTYAAEVAAAVSGKYERLPDYREKLAPSRNGEGNESFLDLAFDAMALGFRDKWIWGESDPREEDEAT